LEPAVPDLIRVDQRSEAIQLSAWTSGRFLRESSAHIGAGKKNEEEEGSAQGIDLCAQRPRYRPAVLQIQ